MTDTVQIALIAGVPPTIAGIVSLVIAVRNGAKTQEHDARSDVRAGELMQKTDEVHTLVDGNLSKVQTALDGANTRIEHLEKIIMESMQSKPNVKQ